MRITIATGPFLCLPPADCGSVEKRWLWLSQLFCEAGHEVVFLSRTAPGLRPEEVLDGVRHVRRTRFRRTRWIGFDLVKDFAYSVRMAMLAPTSDIFVTNTFWLPVVAPRLRRKAGRVVVNVARMPKGQMWLYNLAHRLAAVSSAVKETIAEQQPSMVAKTRVIPNPIVTSVFRPSLKCRDWSGDRTILYTGRVHPEKGLKLLVEAFGAVHQREPRTRLRLVGPWRVEEGGGGSTYRKELEVLGRGLPLEFGEPVYEPESLARELKGAHLYCYPSLADQGESFGVAPLEAMATGLVPIVSDLACFREFLEPGRTGLVFDHKADDAVAQLADRLVELLSDRERTEAMGEAAAERARDFSFENVARMYLDDFQTLLNADDN